MIDPNLALAYGSRGYSYAVLGDSKKAMQDARKACELGSCDLLQYMGKQR
ncbi:hypothetical protein AGMMS50256_24810 [Betaproteobacteria bacterium]|nr:hypothetical protein AGMMS50256_24810 [Betaproteobacteria bacterium]